VLKEEIQNENKEKMNIEVQKAVKSTSSKNAQFKASF
jgi:hypothetical protein